MSLPVIELRRVSKYFARSSPSTTCRSRSPAARCTACSATTAPASRRSSRSSRGCTRRAAARCWWTAARCASNSRARPSTPASPRSTRTWRPSRSSASPATSSWAASRPSGGPFRRLRWDVINATVHQEMGRIGIDVRDPGQAAGTLSGGERQCLAIARAVHFGARVLILDEPTSALGVHQASLVLRLIAHARARARGLAVVLITHNAHHAYPVADLFTLLNRGRSMGTFRKGEITRERVTELMAGGRELVDLEAELAAMAEEDRRRPSPG